MGCVRLGRRPWMELDPDPRPLLRHHPDGRRRHLRHDRRATQGARQRRNSGRGVLRQRRRLGRQRGPCDVCDRGRPERIRHLDGVRAHVRSHRNADDHLDETDRGSRCRSDRVHDNRQRRSERQSDDHRRSHVGARRVRSGRQGHPLSRLGAIRRWQSGAEPRAHRGLPARGRAQGDLCELGRRRRRPRDQRRDGAGRCCALLRHAARTMDERDLRHPVVPGLLRNGFSRIGRIGRDAGRRRPQRQRDRCDGRQGPHLGAWWTRNGRRDRVDGVLWIERTTHGRLAIPRCRRRTRRRHRTEPQSSLDARARRRRARCTPRPRNTHVGHDGRRRSALRRHLVQRRRPHRHGRQRPDPGVDVP